MFSKLAVVSALIALGSTDAHGICGTPEQSTKATRSTNRVMRVSAERRTSNEWISIPTVFHVVQAPGGDSGEGFVPDSAVVAQMEVLNEGYKAAHISFNLTEIKRYENAAWIQLSPDDFDEKVKKATSVDAYNNMNFWSAPLQSGLLGYAQFPTDLDTKPLTDGVVCTHTSLPNMGGGVYGEGDTATHEVGHWLMLYHTFQGGCNADPEGGDGVADTPAEAKPASGCPVGQDSCPDLPGLDPVTNFMDYTHDSCMDHFSEGQIQRMRAAVHDYRPFLLPNVETCAPGCPTVWQGNGVCNDACNVASCGYDQGDCSCEDVPKNWIDSVGDGCAAYGSNQWCLPTGGPGAGWDPSWGSLSDYADANGIDANSACCVCGGGQDAPVPSPAPQTPAPQTPAPSSPSPVTWVDHAGKVCRIDELDTTHGGNCVMVVDGFRSQEDCKSICETQPTCQGIEWGTKGRCEVWTGCAIGALADTPGNFTCSVVTRN